MKRLALTTFALGSAVALTASATTYYWNPTTKSDDSFYHWATAANWLLEDGSAATACPNAADASVVFTNATQTCRPVAGSCGSIVWRGCGPNLSQGTLKLAAGGAGLDLTEATGDSSTSFSVYIALDLSGSGDVIVNTSTRKLRFQKTFTGKTATLVKRGSGLLTLAYEGYRDFSAGGVRIEDGSLTLGNFKPHSGTAFDFAFSGNEGSQLVTLSATNLIVKSLVIHEVNGVTNTTHGFTTKYGSSIHHTGDGKTKVANSDFSGTLSGNIGVMWKPYSEETEFIFRKARHTTTGRLVVSNGVIRVTDGASFPSLAGVEVAGANSRLAVDVDGFAAFPSAPVTLLDGGAVEVPNGRLVTLAVVTNNGEAVANGVYKPVGSTLIGEEAAWVTGTGRVIVGTPVEGETVAATWGGAGADTKATTLANWNGAETLPKLDDGSASVTVTGGTGFTADESVWVKGFDTSGVAAFALGAAAGSDFWLGSAGLVNTAGALAVGGVTLAAPQAWRVTGGSLAVNGDVAALGNYALEIVGNGKTSLSLDAATPSWVTPVVVSNMSVKVNATGALGPQGAAPALIYAMPSFAGGITVSRDLWLCAGGTITGTKDQSLTFDGFTYSTNGCSLAVKAPAGSTITFNKLFMSQNMGGFSGDGRIVFNDSVHFRDRPYMQGTVVVELHKGGNHLSGNMDTFSGGTLKCMGPYVITWDSPYRQTSKASGQKTDNSTHNEISAKDTFILDLNGYDQSLYKLAMHANGTSSGGHVTSATPATLHLQTGNDYWPQHNYRYGFTDYKTISGADGYGYEFADKGSWEGQVTLAWEAESGARRSMMRQSSSSGAVEVASGTLVFLRRAKTANETFLLKNSGTNAYYRLAAEDGAWPNASAARVKGGTLILEHSHVFGRQTALEIVGSTGRVQLDAGVRQRVKSLAIDGVDQGAGVWGGPDSAAANKSDLFAGTGVLKVVGGGLGTLVIVR